MKKFKLFIVSVIAIVCLVVSGGVFTSCSNDDDLLLAGDSQTEKVISLSVDSLKGMTRGMTTTTYYCYPSKGSYLDFSSSSVPLGVKINGSIKTHYGGVIAAQVLNTGGNGNYTIRISKQNNGTFSKSGTAYIKAGSLGGGIADSQHYSAGDSYVELTFSANFAQGVVHFYPMVINDEYPYERFYSEPLLVYTSPMFNMKNSYNTNEVIGVADGVDVKAAGPYLIGNGASVQCTEFCYRYYNDKFGIQINNTGSYGGNADTWFGSAAAKGLVPYNNGSIKPRPGDILCMDNYPYYSGNGHVAIVIDVNGNTLKIAQQNAGIPADSNHYWQWAIGGELSFNPSTNWITSPSGYEIQGLLRMPAY